MNRAVAPPLAVAFFVAALAVSVQAGEFWWMVGTPIPAGEEASTWTVPKVFGCPRLDSESARAVGVADWEKVDLAADRVSTASFSTELRKACALAGQSVSAYPFSAITYDSVPEPASGLMLISGVAALWLRRLRPVRRVRPSGG